MKRSFTVTLEMPQWVTLDEMKEYIHTAVTTWKGQLHPDEPLFDLDSQQVVVTVLPKEWND